MEQNRLIVVGHIFRNSTHFAWERTGDTLCRTVKVGGTMPTGGTEPTCKTCISIRRSSDYRDIPINDLSVPLGYDV